MQINEYPVVEPDPGAIVVKMTVANVCGSDLHYWRGEQDYARMGRPLPLNTGHEHVGTIAKLGDGVTTDAAGRPLSLGDRVAYRYFFPCGHCKACLARHFKSCPVRQANWLVSCEQWPHFQGGFGQYFYLRPNHAMFKLPPEITDEMAAGVNCAYTQVYAGLDIAGLKAGQTVVVQGAGGLGVYACAVAREMGAGRVIVIDGIDERLELAQNRQRLLRERHDVLLGHLHAARGNPPFGIGKIELGPFRRPQLSGADEDERRKSECQCGHGLSVIAVDREQELPDARRVCQGGEVP